MALNFAFDKFCVQRVPVWVEEHPWSGFKTLCVSTDVVGAVLEKGAAVAFSLTLDPVPCVVHSVEFVIGEVVDGATAMRNLRVSESSSALHLPLVEPSIQVVVVKK